jgi:hypothetical protein
MLLLFVLHILAFCKTQNIFGIKQYGTGGALTLKRHRFPASLRHVIGFPDLGLLRWLRPRSLSSRVAAGSLVSRQAKKNEFPRSD